MADALTTEMHLHLAEPFPDSVEKGAEYGEVVAVMIDADIYGGPPGPGRSPIPIGRA